MSERSDSLLEFGESAFVHDSRSVWIARHENFGLYPYHGSFEFHDIFRTDLEWQRQRRWRTKRSFSHSHNSPIDPVESFTETFKSTNSGLVSRSVRHGGFRMRQCSAEAARLEHGSARS